MLWLIRLATWDGLLPLAVWLVPLFIRTTFPRDRQLYESVGILLPIVVLFLRFFFGWRTIQSNRCRVWVRCLQTIALCAGILVMMCVDALLMMSHELGPMTEWDQKFVAMLIGGYLALMAFATFPGRAPEGIEAEDLEWESAPLRTSE